MIGIVLLVVLKPVLTAIQVVDTEHVGLAERTFIFICLCHLPDRRQMHPYTARVYWDGRCIGPPGPEARLSTFPLHFRRRPADYSSPSPPFPGRPACGK